MGTSGGPNVNRDGLVLFLDTPSRRSFRGEPTTNVVTNWNLDTGWSKGYTEDIVFNEIPPPRGVNAPTVGFRNDDTSGDGYWYSYGNYAPQDSSTTYTISVYAKTNQTDNRFFLRAYTANNSENGRHWTNGIYLTAADGWKRIVWPSFTTISNNESDSLSFRYDNLYQGGYTRLWLCAPQMEANTKATRFVKGTRGTTVATGGGWKDISGNGNHGQILNGVTTDNVDGIKGALAFDGTNDAINLGTNKLNLTNKSFTLETVLKWDGNSTDTFFGHHYATAQRQSIHWRVYDTGQLRFDFYSDSINSSAGAIQANVIYHLTVTYNYDTDTCVCYRNGKVLMSGTSGPFTGLEADSTTNIGRWSSTLSQHFGGNIYIFKAYDRVLSPSEVLQNYKAIRSRYGL